MKAVAALALILVVDPAMAAPAAPTIATPGRIAIPDGEHGIGYDDLQYAPGLRRILVPAGRTGRLVLLDPATNELVAIDGFSSTSSFFGGHGQGTTSAVEIDGQRGLVVATDRGSRSLKIVDAKAKQVIGSVRLAAGPDYVRSVSATHEIWVTEPGPQQIEVFSFNAKEAEKVSHVATVSVPGGPESLVIDAVRGRAYTHTWTDKSYAIDLKSRKIVATWPNGCRDSRGIALDEARGFLFAACAEGKVTVIDVTRGRILATASAGADVDSIGYSATLGHLYVPGAGTADLSIFGVTSGGKVSLLGKVATAPDSHTAAFDPATRTVFVGTPQHGAVLAIRDPFPSSLD